MKKPEIHRPSTNSTLYRRAFRGSTAAAAITIVPRHVLGAHGNNPPSNMLNLAGMGLNDIRCRTSENIVALCDFDHLHAAKVFKQFPKANVYADFRWLLEKQRDIDAEKYLNPP